MKQNTKVVKNATKKTWEQMTKEERIDHSKQEALNVFYTHLNDNNFLSWLIDVNYYVLNYKRDKPDVDMSEISIFLHGAFGGLIQRRISPDKDKEHTLEKWVMNFCTWLDDDYKKYLSLISAAIMNDYVEYAGDPIADNTLKTFLHFADLCEKGAFYNLMSRSDK